MQGSAQQQNRSIKRFSRISVAVAAFAFACLLAGAGISNAGSTIAAERSESAPGTTPLVRQAEANPKQAVGPDPTFAGDGRRTDFFPGSGNDTANALVVQADGKIVVAGTSDYGFDSACTISRFNTDGSPDASFGTAGQVLIPPSDDRTNFCAAVALQADGKIIAVGSAHNELTNEGDFLIFRLNPDGSLDTSFAGTGAVTTSVSNAREGAHDVAILSDGRIVTAGYTNITGAICCSDFALVRYHPDGSLDTSFDTDGKVVTPTQSTFTGISAIAIQPDGKIVAGGTTNGVHTEGDFALARYHVDGSLDTSFGGTGVVVTAAGGGNLYDVVLQPDGKIIAAGEVFDGSSSFNFTLARYHPNGSPDTSFDSDGIVTTAVLTSGDGARSVALQPDGKIVAAGYGFRGTASDFVLVRYNANGSLDTSFDTDGKVTTPRPASGGATAVALLTDGRILTAGYDANDTDSDFALLRYNLNGTLDTSFGTEGHTSADIGQSYASAQSVALQPDGRIVAAGSVFNGSDTDFALIRYHADGSLDTSFGVEGKVTTPILARDAIAYAVALQPDGKIVAAGDASSSSALARYHPDGSLDSSFDGDGKVTSASGDVRGLALQADGKIVTGGTIFIGGRNVFALTRYQADGSLDLSFDADGRVATPVLGSFDRADAFLLQPDGKMVLAGTARNGTAFEFALVRYLPDGALDTSFDGDGKVTTPIRDAEDIINAVALQPDGKIIAAGYAANGEEDEFALVRYNSDGSLDTSFGTNGKVTTPVSDGRADSVAVQSDGKIVAAGSAFDGSHHDFLVIRYNPDGSLDSSYGDGGKVLVDFDSRTHDYAHALALDSQSRAIVVGIGSDSFAIARLGPIGAGAGRLLNIATRLRVGAGENVLIGGFIITGTDPKKVIIRGIGPSLAQFFNGTLDDPTLQLFQGNTPLASNNDWRESEAEVTATGIPPSHDKESAIVRTLAPGSYTAILGGNGGSTGIGVVEVYDLDQNANSKLANIASRGFVDIGDNVMIGGLIVGPADGASAKVVVRAMGPSLESFGIAGALQDPTLDLVNSNGVVLRANNNWQDSQQAEIEATGLQPGDIRESTLIEMLAPGNYTAIVRGAGNTTGVGLVEVYNLQ